MTVEPLSTVFGTDRGIAADRYYIELFLSSHAERIAGRCLEVTDDAYVRRFGAHRVTHTDILDINPQNPRATIVGDLQDLSGSVPSATYDCAVITQVFQFLANPERGVRELHRILAPGGSALVTVPCLGRVEPARDEIDLWRFMPSGAQHLFSCVPWESTEISRYGNALLGMAIWSGMAIGDLPRRAWNRNDPDWPCIVGIRATKAAPVHA
jgi:SAM-dependent methyltransferase